MDISRLVLQVLGQHGKARAIVLLGSKNTSFNQVCPEHVLLVNSQGEWEMDSMQDDLSVLASQCGTLDLISGKF